MGYYTNFELTVTPEPSEELHKYLTVSDYNQLLSYIGAFYRYPTGEYSSSEWKWYNWEDDMLDLSIRFPDYVFRLFGDGEDRDDLWVAFFKNGLSYTVNLIVDIPPFDESKLA